MMELEFAVTPNELMDLGSNYQQAILLQQEKMINQYVPLLCNCLAKKGKQFYM